MPSLAAYTIFVVRAFSERYAIDLIARTEPVEAAQIADCITLYHDELALPVEKCVEALWVSGIVK